MLLRTFPGPLGLFFCVVSMCILGSPQRAHAETSQDALRFDLKVGLETDNNALRKEGTERTSDALTRYFFKMESNHAWGRAQRLGVRLRSGGKLFRKVREENTLINQVDARYSLFPTRTFSSSEPSDDSTLLPFLFAAGGLKDRTEDTSLRDYIRGSAEGGLGLFWEGVTWTVSGGIVSFAFKPNADLSSTGPSLTTQLNATFLDAWNLRAFASTLDRFYNSAPIVIGEDGGADLDPRVTREDTVLTAGGGGGYRGEEVLVEIDGNVQKNGSNSYGQTFLRYGFTINSTLALPWDILLHGRASLQRTAYDDELFIDETLVVDEDNRNTYVFSLERPIWWEGWRVEGRYALYTQEFGSANADYTRQLIFIGLAVGN